MADYNAPFINPATGEPVPYADFVDKQMPTTYEQIAAALSDPNWYFQTLEGVGGVTGGPAGAVTSGLGWAAKGMGKATAATFPAGRIMARAREIPGQIADGFGSFVGDAVKGFRGGNVTQAEQRAADAKRAVAEYATRKQELARQLELERTEAPRFRGQVPPENANWHEIANALRAFEDSAPFSMRAPDGRSLSQADTYFDLGRMFDKAEPPAGLTQTERALQGPRYPSYEEFLASRQPQTPSLSPDQFIWPWARP